MEKPRKCTDTEKWCPICEQWKLHADFFRSITGTAGLKGYCKDCSIKLQKTPEVKTKRRSSRQRDKIKVLTHYGKYGMLQCCWPACTETDIDMLTLDHINNDGYKERKNASGLYAKLLRDTFPAGFQTLCANHQLKKKLVYTRTLIEIENE